MDPTALQPGEQRLLAAIVFTDVVGFSRLAAKNESRSYQALQRDMDIMTRLCQSHNGQVLNTMGDGMLMSFSSAVDAMSCAIQIQQTFASQAATLPALEVLHHRIGVHLGDVIVKGDNVFGDGVNTASRLQTHARPDSIWFSDTVHELVKNKVKMDDRYLGPRTFKNLGQTVKVWEIPPVVEAVARHEAAAAGLSPDLILDTPIKDGASGGKALALVLCSVILIAIAGVIVSKIRTGDLLPTKKPGAVDTAILDPQTQTTPPDTGPKPTTDPDPNPKPTVSPTDALNKIEAMKSGYHFQDIATYLRGEGSVVPNSRDLAAEFDALTAMSTWLVQGLGQTSHADTVHVAATSTDYFMNGNQLCKEQNGSGFQPIVLDELPPKEMADVMQALATKQGATAPHEFPGWLTAFDQEYKISSG